ncbi:MAG: aconitate hydratase [Gaiellaceae bacterium]|jgi:aconitate hydratase
MANSFGARSLLKTGDSSYEIFRLEALLGVYEIASLPFSLRVLLENTLRHEGVSTTTSDVEAIASWEASAEPNSEISFIPARVLLQDFTGVPAIVDLAAMRDAMRALGGEPAAINPQLPAELVIDHSLQVDEAASPFAIERNTEIEYVRNRERYLFLRWGQSAFANSTVVPPGTGIVHQVNLEHLARVVEARDGVVFPDTLIGTDSHTTMANGLGVLGWGVGGIEAEAAMLGEPVSMLVPQVVGLRLAGELREGVTATDLVLTVTELLRRAGVVGKFVEYYGPGITALALADRATLANMAPEYGATCGFFPVDAETLRYLRLTGRSDEHVSLVEAYCKENMLWHDPGAEPRYSRLLELDLGSVEPSLAGPRRPQDRVPLAQAKRSFCEGLATFGIEFANGSLDEAIAETFPASDSTAEQAPGHKPVPDPRPEVHEPTTAPGGARLELDGTELELGHGAVVIAAITSCTNTSNPQVMIGAGLLAKKAVEHGLACKPWVKTSLAPGSRAVQRYYQRSGLEPYLEQLGFHIVGFGCTTCIGNSGPLPLPVTRAIDEGELVTCAVLSGNRNFEARIHPDVKANYLASPMLVVAYAIAGRMDIDLTSEPLGQSASGEDVFLRDIWPSAGEISDAIESSIDRETYVGAYSDIVGGDERWRALPVSENELFDWQADSTYVRRPPYFDEMTPTPGEIADLEDVRCLAVLGDSVTTDHISPAGPIDTDSPAGSYLLERGVAKRDFNSYGSRRGNHELMVRGTFANVRLRNALAPGTEGGWTTHIPSGEVTTIFAASERYLAEGTALIVLAGKEYGSGSSRDWAAKGPRLLGVRAVIAESYERIHRSNLLMMGIVPLQFRPGECREALGLGGRELYSIAGLGGQAREATVTAVPDGGGEPIAFRVHVRLDTPREREYVRHGGILPFVLRRLLAPS